MKTIALLIFTFLLFACHCKYHKETAPVENQEYIYSYSVLTALNNGIFSGDLPISELKTKGDLGLGTYENLDGEMVFLDGTPFQVLENGDIVEATDSMATPYAVVTFFEEDHKFDIEGTCNYTQLKAKILDELPSENYFYAFEIKGHFTSVNCGGAPKQNKPYSKTLAEIIPGRPLFNAENISGTIVGFYCPSYVGEMTLAGFHLHFLADDKTIGGHLIDFESSNIHVGFD